VENGIDPTSEPPLQIPCLNTPIAVRIWYLKAIPGANFARVLFDNGLEGSVLIRLQMSYVYDPAFEKVGLYLEM